MNDLQHMLNSSNGTINTLQYCKQCKVISDKAYQLLAHRT